MVDIYTLHFDGSCGPKNPGGTAAYGFTLARFAEEIDKGHGIVGSGPEMSNNVAEYVGLAKGLLAVIPHFTGTYGFLNVRGDSRLVINQMSRKWKAKSGLYYPYYLTAMEACASLRARGARITFEWIPREMNQVCDDLSKAHQTA